MNPQTTLATALVVTLILISLLSSSYTSARAPVQTRTLLSYGTISQNVDLPKLKGINIFVDDWVEWNSTIINREINDIKTRGFNFVRTLIMFYRFYDFKNNIVSPTLDPSLYNLTVLFMNSLKTNGLYASVVPCEWGDYLYYQDCEWYTNSSFQKMMTDYYEAFSKWCYDNQWNNILYVSVWWEPEYYDKWYDGYYTLENNLSSFGEANIAWESWLSQNGRSPETLMLASINSNMYLYVSWSREVFSNVTKLKSDAVKRGWPGISVGADVGFVNNPNNSPMYMPDAYLNLTGSKYLDVIEFHDYFPPGFVDVPFLEAAKTLNKPIVMAELGAPWWMGIDATKTDDWLSNVEPKMETMLDNASGFAIWAWQDYSDFAWGLKDSNFVPREVLSNVTEWLTSH